MTLRRALIPGCVIALFSLETLAQEASSPAPAPEPQTPAAAAPAAQPEAAAPAPAAPAAAPAAPATGRTVKGRATDRLTGEGLPLVRVIIKGTTQGVETELDGSFALPNVPQGAVTLLISSQDYGEKEIRVGANQGTVNIQLDNVYSEEMVVVGRASEIARKHLANSVTSVNAEELNRAPVQTVDAALQGKVAGANIQSNSGAPGGGLQLRLRGVSTVYASSAPLYVIDGVLVSDVAIANGMFAVTESVGGSNPNPTQDNQVNRIADINPNDIESIEILKGASAAAIYGSKAANGVVIINTKRGTSSEPKFEVTQRVGVYTLANKIGTRRFETREEAEDAFGPDAAQYYQDGRVFDHEGTLAGRRDLSTETLASVSGKSGNTRYFASAMLKNDEGIINNTGYEKQSFRLNLGQQLGESVEVNVSTNVVHSLGQRGLTNNDNTLTTNHMVLPFTPEFLDQQADSQGVYPQNPFVPSGSNPLQTVQLVQNDEDVWRFIGAGDATWHLLKTDEQHLRVLANAGLDRFQQENNLFFPPALNFEPVDGEPGTALFGTSQVRNLNAGLNLVHTFKPASGFMTANSSAGVQFEERNINSVYIVSRNLNAGQPRVDSGMNVDLRENTQEVRDRGYYVQEEMLLLDERLTLVGALRAEQSSANGNVNALFFYPKLATAYRLPSFHPSVNEFKVRAAYGETGNQPLYGMKFTGLSPTGNIGGNPGLNSLGVLGDKDIRPERQREFELGVDAIFFGGNVVTELSVYQRSISDLILQRTLASSVGYTSKFENGGSLRNRGIEAMVQVTPLRGAFEWTSSATFALNRSRVTSLPEGAFNAGGFGTALGVFRMEEGQSATQIYGNAGPREDGTCCVQKKIGDTEPDFRMGFANTLRYQDVSLSFLWDWQQGSDVINLTRYIYDAAGTSPDYETNAAARQERSSFHADAYLEDASFVKLREVTLSYQLPQSWVSTIPQVKSARLSLSGRNLLTFTSYSGLDPEVSNFGNQALARNIDVAPFPPSRSFWTSLDVGF